MLKKFIQRALLEISSEPVYPHEESSDEEFGMDIGLPETFDNLLRQMKRASRENRVSKEELDFFIAGLEKLATRHNLIH